MPEGNNAVAVLLMLALIFGGLVILMNWVPMLGLGFNNISGFTSGVWIVIVKIVAVALIVIPAWVIYNIIRG